jgi:hypothetical protein
MLGNNFECAVPAYLAATCKVGVLDYIPTEDHFKNTSFNMYIVKFDSDLSIYGYTSKKAIKDITADILNMHGLSYASIEELKSNLENPKFNIAITFNLYTTLDELMEDLKSYPKSVNKIYGVFNPSYLMQGDILRGIKTPSYKNGEYTTEIRNVMLLSNTCDVSQDNTRKYYNPSLVFAPIYDLKKTKEKLILDGHRESDVTNFIKSVKEQQITSFFFLPTISDKDEGYFVRFDHVFHIPTDCIPNNEINNIISQRAKTLSQTGFYFLLFKLSINFTRVYERIDRNNSLENQNHH